MLLGVCWAAWACCIATRRGGRCYCVRIYFVFVFETIIGSAALLHGANPVRELILSLLSIGGMVAAWQPPWKDEGDRETIG